MSRPLMLFAAVVLAASCSADESSGPGNSYEEFRVSHAYDDLYSDPGGILIVEHVEVRDNAGTRVEGAAVHWRVTGGELSSSLSTSGAG
ncbi:MAG: hypothetical protein ACREKH_12750, partial [Candidatus Rokuibacteriota bacterium]